MRLTIRVKLALALFLAVALATGASVWVAVRSLGALADVHTEADLVGGLKTVEAILDLKQRTALGLAELLAGRDDLREAVTGADRAALVRLGRRWMQEYDLDYVVVTDARGIVMARAHAPERHGDDGNVIPTIQAALHGRSVATIRRAPIIALGASGTVPVFQGRPPYGLLGTVSAGFALDDAFVAGLKTALGLDVSLILDGNRRHSTLPAAGPMSRDLLAAASAPGAQGGARVEAGGQSYRALYGALRGRDGAPPVGHFEVAESEAEVQAALRRTFGGLAVAAGAVGLAVIGAALWLGARLTAPLEGLSLAAAALGERRTHSPIEVSGDDEVARLARAFNRMAEDIGRSNEELAASERRFRELYENAPSGYLSVAADGRISHCNPALVTLLGARSAEALIGRPVMELWADGPSGRTRAASLARRLYAGEDLPPQEIQMRRADGSPVWVTASVSATRDPAGAIVLFHGSVVDITERKQAEEAREALTRIAARLADCLDAGEVARRISDAVIPLLGVRRATLRGLQPDGSLAVMAWAPRDAPPAPTAGPIPPGVGLSGRVLREGRAVWSADVLAEPELQGAEALGRRIVEDGAAAALVAPLRVGGSIIATLSAGDTTGRRFTPAEAALLQAFADQAAVALERARLFEEA